MLAGSLIGEWRRAGFLIDFENPTSIPLYPRGAPGLMISRRGPCRRVPQNDARLALNHVVDNAGLLHDLQRIGARACSVPNTQHYRIGRQPLVNLTAAL